MTKVLFILWVCISAFKSNAEPLIFSEIRIQKFDSLTILISEANGIYYYNNELEPDASNFNASSSLLSKVKELISRFQNESKEKRKNLLIIVKVQKTSALSSGTKTIIDYIKQQPHYKLAAMKEVEKFLINATEGANK